jgi:hypothetical protein
MLEFVAAQADLMLAAVSFVFAASLAPTVADQWRRRASTVPLSTSLVTFAGLAVVVLVYAALELWVAMVVSSVTAALWGVIAAQRVLYSRRSARAGGLAEEVRRALLPLQNFFGGEGWCARR